MSNTYKFSALEVHNNLPLIVQVTPLDELRLVAAASREGIKPKTFADNVTKGGAASRRNDWGSAAQPCRLTVCPAAVLHSWASARLHACMVALLLR